MGSFGRSRCWFGWESDAALTPFGLLCLLCLFDRKDFNSKKGTARGDRNVPSPLCRLRFIERIGLQLERD